MLASHPARVRGAGGGPARGGGLGMEPWARKRSRRRRPSVGRAEASRHAQWRQGATRPEVWLRPRSRRRGPLARALASWRTRGQVRAAAARPAVYFVRPSKARGRPPAVEFLGTAQQPNSVSPRGCGGGSPRVRSGCCPAVQRGLQLAAGLAESRVARGMRCVDFIRYGKKKCVRFQIDGFCFCFLLVIMKMFEPSRHVTATMLRATAGPVAQ